MCSCFKICFTTVKTSRTQTTCERQTRNSARYNLARRGSVRIGCRDTPRCTPRMFRLSKRAPETDGLIRPAGERLICAAAEDVAYYASTLKAKSKTPMPAHPAQGPTPCKRTSPVPQSSPSELLCEERAPEIEELTRETNAPPMQKQRTAKSPRCR